MAENPSATVPAVVEKIIKVPGAPEKAQLTVESGDHLYREIRIENTLIDDKGREVSLKSGAEVQITIDAAMYTPTPSPSTERPRAVDDRPAANNRRYVSGW